MRTVAAKPQQEVTHQSHALSGLQGHHLVTSRLIESES